jgi:hypothetical protein
MPGVFHGRSLAGERLVEHRHAALLQGGGVSIFEKDDRFCPLTSELSLLNALIRQSWRFMNQFDSIRKTWSQGPIIGQLPCYNLTPIIFASKAVETHRKVAPNLNPRLTRSIAGSTELRIYPVGNISIDHSPSHGFV